MRRPASLAVLLAVLLAALLVLGGGAVGTQAEEPAPAPPPAADPLVVHEWGTFTSMVGAEGLALEGLQDEEEALPEFVYSRAEVRACPLRDVGWKGLEVPVNHVTHKMETPVLYVHSRTPRRLQVRVDFVGGLISQWYPVSDLLGPPERSADAGPLDLRTVERSFLAWDVDVLPRAGGPPPGIPAVAADDPWAFAREVDAAYLRTRPRAAPEREGPVEAEHYLFYRGVGRLRLPFDGGEAQGLLTFRNGSAQRVAQVLALEVGPEGRTARYTIECGVEPGAEVRLRTAARPFAPLEQVLPGLQSDMQKILRGQGLFEDEARAMVRTWARSWFASEGARLLYVLPREETDRLLPLAIQPVPDRLVRVLVGRLEVITQAVQAEVERALEDLERGQGPAREAAQARLVRLGRFREAHLEQVARHGSTAEARARGQAQLEALRAERASRSTPAAAAPAAAR